MYCASLHPAACVKSVIFFWKMHRNGSQFFGGGTYSGETYFREINFDFLHLVCLSIHSTSYSHMIFLLCFFYFSRVRGV